MAASHKEMKIVSIGAGNLATNLCVALHKSHHDILQVFSRKSTSAECLACRIGASPVTDMELIATDADIYIVSVTDSALADVARRLVDHLEAGNQGGALPLIVHTAGSIAMDVIPAARRGVVYPMQTFSKQRLVDFSQIPIFIEANYADDLEMLRLFATSLSSHVQVLSSTDRRYLHLAAVFCSNFTNHCYALADKILSQHNVPFSAMLPLIDEVAAKVHSMPPHEAQTGPARRHDANVMNEHIELLTNDKRLQNIYKIMSESIADD